ncbi:hypothetical protein EJD97_013549 [Solanum chilense]|uniref:Uncharacterized protein n=1 Tax=Solanum chilense TaxID=4083 RepID=A0A6N2AHN1_SOLCI|nr:hypothetical protein EJD97_013549 [Solanum chilense]
MPMYCKNYNLQGHKESECFILHPELRMEEEKVDVSEELRGNSPTDKGKTICNDEMNTPIKILKFTERDNDVLPINNRKYSAGKLNSHQNNDDLKITGTHKAIINELVNKENIVEVAIIEVSNIADVHVKPQTMTNNINEIAKAADMSPRQTEPIRGSSTKQKGVKGNNEAPTIRPLSQRLAASKKFNKYSN